VELNAKIKGWFYSSLSIEYLCPSQQSVLCGDNGPVL